MAEQKRSAELDEIWSLFAQEGKENLALAEGALLQLEQASDDMEQIKVLFRAVHSFKGGARMMGLGVVESLAHHAEDLIALVRDDGVALHAEMIDLLLHVLDRLRAMLDQVVAAGHDVEPSEAAGLAESLQQMLALNAPTGVSQPPQAPLAAPDQHQPDQSTHATEPAAAPIEPADGNASPTTDTAVETTCQVVCTVPSDPNDLAGFLKRIEADLAQLHEHLDAFAASAPDALAQIQSVATHLRAAAESMGYQRLTSILEELDRVTRADGQADAAANGSADHYLHLKKVELEIFEELTNIQDHAAASANAAESNWTDVAWLFRHWNAERVFADLARLSEIADALDQLTKQLAVETMASRQSATAADEARVLLKAIYHSCIFYHLDQAVHLSLALADIYGRIAQGELIASDALTRLTRAYVTNLGSAIDAVREGALPSLEEFPKLIEQTQNFLYLHTDGPVFEVTRSVLDVLKLPAEFKEVMTPETMTKFSRALQQGERFYTVLADLERDETLGTAFLAWSQSEAVHLITNITVYRYKRTLFNFLFATSLSHAETRAAMAQLDPHWQYLTLEECVVREQVDLAKREEKTTLASEAESAAAWHGGTGVSTQLIENISETISTLMAEHATLRRVVSRLASKDLLEAVVRTTQDPRRMDLQADAASARRDLEDYLREWTDGINALSQVENQVGAALGQLQEATRSLRLMSAAEILNPLRRMTHELAQRQGKLVELDLQGTELTLERGALQALEELVRRLVWFAVTQSIEDVESRRAKGKAAAGRVLVKVSKGEDHAQVIVEDDGAGLDRTAIQQRVKELGWAKGNGNAASELDLVLQPGFGPVGTQGGAAGIDLVGISEQLRARHGRLSVQSDAERGKGTRFDIRLPLEMAVVDGMVVRVDAVRYIVPVSAIRRIVKTDPTNLVYSSAEGKHTLLKFEGELVQIQSLAGDTNSRGAERLVVVVDTERGRIALRIDELIGRQQVLVRPLQGQLSDVQDVSGCALLGEGEVGMVLSMRFDGNNRARTKA